ncbi:uncharacterized protein K452DRAFT_292754 [Aplosporella prunicola CBS 121167]|uniref:SnoaL-like domain-containing protein n=1 Tax=Aplosporella prunicola CBS 121167 TaxID=1176127 RepID=A0A6A6AW99_9PEZI|nr:uncharacterized protein K452DRAFT_292754 [Aplosporella prunicola CBS 121167]KAF2135990.1 hypothetical protein K452DRAFT_292754 [Aplosporella prunicola CBS 121167]
MASITLLPAVLSPAPTDREAIADTIHRFAQGIDHNDAPVFDSAFTSDATLCVNGPTYKGLPAIRENCFDVINKMDTLHQVTNIRINIAEDGVKASMTAYCLSQHFRSGMGMMPGQERLLAGTTYSADLVKDGSSWLWKFEKLVLKSTWAEGNWDVILEAQK